ncbi:hypothetical protein C2R22_16110 [Salinigranum rubrum]|uniref:Uncharacterized protein n=1 Tax=Salinigranum rubrum TaxID=755307 RepID=A0A2I8VM24_9EURY|nr:hypothetical protein C2R22_16110 [Salinigranum rubrum]
MVGSTRCIKQLGRRDADAGPVGSGPERLQSEATPVSRVLSDDDMPETNGLGVRERVRDVGSRVPSILYAEARRRDRRADRRRRW